MTTGSTLDDFKKNLPENEPSCAPIVTDDYASNRSLEKKARIENSDNTIFCQYSKAGDNYIPCGQTTSRLSKGVYKISRTDSGLPVFMPSYIKSDSWLNFRDDIINNVTDEIDKFWDRRDIFTQYGFLQRRGYMFYGPAGTGKSVLIKQLIQKIVDRDGIVFLCDTHPDNVQNGLKHFSNLEPDRNIICVFEDVDAIINRYGDSELLTLLDGEDSVDHVLNIATTNYPERLDRRIVGRPRRFDRIIKIGYPEPDMREYYFKHKLESVGAKIDSKEVDKWVSHTEKFTFAALTELVISVKCLGNEFDSSVKRLRDLLEIKVSSDEYKIGKSIGFDPA